MGGKVKQGAWKTLKWWNGTMSDSFHITPSHFWSIAVIKNVDCSCFNAATRMMDKAMTTGCNKPEFYFHIAEAVKFKHRHELQILNSDCHSAHWVSSSWHRAVREALPLQREEEKHVALTGVWACQSSLTAAFGISVRYKRCVWCQSTSSQTGIQTVCLNNNNSSE